MEHDDLHEGSTENDCFERILMEDDILALIGRDLTKVLIL